MDIEGLFMKMHELRERARLVFNQAIDIQGPVALLDFSSSACGVG